MPKYPPTVTERDCVAALRKRYPAPQFAFFEQVANGTGMKARRWADAVAMGIWPSRGMLIHGFEIKVSRGDWLRELKKPEKSAEVQAYCHRWHIVAPKGLIPKDELPPTWGLLEVAGKQRMTTAVEAPPLDARDLTRDFVAAMLRRHHEAWAALLTAEYARGVEDGARDGHGDLANRLSRAEERYAQLKRVVASFEEKSGVHIRHEWNLGNVSEAVRVLSRGTHHSLADALDQTASRYEAQCKRLRDDARALREAEGTD